MSIISVKNLSKTFKKPIRKEGLGGMIKGLFSHKYEEVRAVDDISFDIEEGEIVGYIGANGAGKSTTIKMMCGILHPTDGSISVDGLDFNKNRQQINRRMGAVFGQKTQLWWDIPLIETTRCPTRSMKKNSTICAIFSICAHSSLRRCDRYLLVRE